jgi:hypothetical protein
MPISERERRAQAMARIRLDNAFVRAEQKMLEIIAKETEDIVFGFMMDAGDLSPATVAKVRAIFQAFRLDREICMRKIVEIRRRQLAVLLQDEPAPITQYFPRWSKN